MKIAGKSARKAVGRQRWVAQRGHFKSPMFGPKYILVPTDFSEPSNNSLKYAIRFSDRFGARIILIHIVKPIVFPYDEYSLPDLLLDDKQPIKAATKSLKELGQKNGTDPIWKRLVRKGTPAQEIVKAAREFGVDLIIIATRGFSGVKRVLVGSTTEQVIRHAPCPVLVVRQNERELIT